MIKWILVVVVGILICQTVMLCMSFKVIKAYKVHLNQAFDVEK